MSAWPLDVRGLESRLSPAAALYAAALAVGAGARLSLPGAAFCAVGLAFALLEAFASFSVTDISLLWLMLGIALALPGSPAASDA